ncbi:hypothetical protein [Clostridium kluyveri]|uniref:hypothetical protein n=1 Tax=Clostridium kluyveri TaxID=1534 RepID=UPI00224858F8|nr:hypothetical protein [Clostridium kluyveri]UZQ50935.1 hypothetical protein OP486_01785 [Clostridium kluyveri]
MEKVYELKSSAKIRTAYGDFYKTMIEEGFFQYQYQLFTYAFLVGIQSGGRRVLPTKNKDICEFSNINPEILKAILKGIALMKIEADDGDQLLKKIMDYADRGIQIIQKEYEEIGTINLEKYFD